VLPSRARAHRSEFEVREQQHSGRLREDEDFA
jgi:hypothetical protein